MLPLYREPHFTFRFADDRIIPRFQLEGVEAGRRVSVFRLDGDEEERQALLATATVGEGGWVDLPEPLVVRAGGGFVAVPEPARLGSEPAPDRGSRLPPGTTMIRFRKPTPAALDEFLAAQARLDFTYTGVGTTAATPPAGYTVDRTRVRLGDGEAVFRAAASALGRWDQFRLGWVEAHPADATIRPGGVVAVVARVLGAWWANACRVVYTVEEDGPVCRAGFAYGTLPGHAESGEERFLVEWDRATDAVWYDILAFSSPRHPLARLGYPLTRRTQRRFARDSAAVMRRVVSERPQGK